jgi:transcriptional antiterminator RfaH
MKQWYAVYTQPRNEERAQQHLRRQRFEVLLPRYLKRRSHARRVTMVPVPLFPRYLFVSFDPEQQRWRAIRSTRGVIDLVSNGEIPVPVPDAVVSEIERRRDADGYVVLARHLDLRRGTRIRIDAGPFSGTEAIFEAKRDDERVIALLTLMGREVVVQLPIRAVAPA